MSRCHLVNANIHRMKEGARVLEDIARFILRDNDLFVETRALRHGLKISAPMAVDLQDLGGSHFIENNMRKNILDVVYANVIRVQESLRVLEEMSMAAHDKQKIKILRYQAYQLQADFVSKTRKYLRHERLTGLYLVIDPTVIPYTLADMAVIINQTDVNLVQYRNKLASKQAIYNEAADFRSLLNPDKLFIMNDHLDIAVDIADGVHLGQDDYPLEFVRNIITEDFIFGVSCHTVQEAQHAQQVGASYIAVGCVFDTNSKKDTIPISFTELANIKQLVTLPICPIGGINADNLSQVLSTGVQMTALISYVWFTPDPLASIREMHTRIIA